MFINFMSSDLTDMCGDYCATHFEYDNAVLREYDFMLPVIRKSTVIEKGTKMNAVCDRTTESRINIIMEEAVSVAAYGDLNLMLTALHPLLNIN
ncbi:hypothetical protein ACTXT7_001851 [Hymenolepis weldensis]